MTTTVVTPRNLAAIDIGSNAARLLIKRLDVDAEGRMHFSKRRI